MDELSTNLVGQTLAVEERQYRIVDVRRVGGETMVYAEPVAEAKGPGRAAFRYADIEERVQEPPSGEQVA